MLPFEDMAPGHVLLLNVFVLMANVIAFVVNSMLWSAHRTKCYDRSATILAEELGANHVQYTLEKELSRVYAHYTNRNSAAGIESDDETEEATEDETTDTDDSSGSESDSSESESDVTPPRRTARVRVLPARASEAPNLALSSESESGEEGEPVSRGQTPEDETSLAK